MSKKATQVPPSGLNPPLLALFVDLCYSICIFLCRLVVTENILGGGNCPPGYAPEQQVCDEGPGAKPPAGRGKGVWGQSPQQLKILVFFT